MTPAKPTDLLDGFIAEKLTAAPRRAPRAGVRPDEQREFGRKKVHAALLHLRLGGDLADLRDVADAAKVSASLLGKWRAENPRLKAAVDAHKDEFVALVVGRLAEEHRREGSAAMRFHHVEAAAGLALHSLGEGAPWERWSPDVRLAVYRRLVDAVPAEIKLYGVADRSTMTRLLAAALAGYVVARGAMAPDARERESGRLTGMLTAAIDAVANDQGLEPLENGEAVDIREVLAEVVGLAGGLSYLARLADDSWERSSARWIS